MIRGAKKKQSLITLRRKIKQIPQLSTNFRVCPILFNKDFKAMTINMFKELEKSHV